MTTVKNVYLTCSICGIEKDEMLFVGTLKTRPNRKTEGRVCKLCSERRRRLHAYHAKDTIADQNAETQKTRRIVNAMTPLLPLETKNGIIRFIEEKKIVIRGALGVLKETPEPVKGMQLNRNFADL